MKLTAQIFEANIDSKLTKNLISKVQTKIQFKSYFWDLGQLFLPDQYKFNVKVKKVENSKAEFNFGH